MNKNVSLNFFIILSLFILLPGCNDSQKSNADITNETPDISNALLNPESSDNTNKPGCPFCEIITGKKDQQKIIAQNEYAMAIQKELSPRSPVDFLIIPKRYTENLKSMNFNNAQDQQILIHMYKLLQELWQKGSAISGNSGEFSITINNGPESKQTVSHLHMHVQSPDKTWGE